MSGPHSYMNALTSDGDSPVRVHAVKRRRYSPNPVGSHTWVHATHARAHMIDLVKLARDILANKVSRVSWSPVKVIMATIL